ncbi:MAG: hypothetical protein H0W61_05710 [Bacteroidetes bacterium]|nr:hypothetical protein [Bacteroidota bacterium]
MKKQLNSLIFFFYASFTFSQIDIKFIHHLAANDLQTEHSTYLTSITPLKDSVFYFRAKFDLKYKQDSLFFADYLKSKTLCRADTEFINEAGIYFLKTRDKDAKTWFNNLPAGVSKTADCLSIVYAAATAPNLYQKENFPEDLQRPYEKYKRAYNKKPFVAGLLSTIIPGAGKLYAGKTKTFFLTFLLSAAYAAQTIESANKLGIKHPLTIINLTAFSVFYLSNIYGSYRAVIDLRKERKKQFLSDAARFYY